MSSPDHPTFDIKDAFSFNFSDYFPNTPGNTSPDSSNDLIKYLLATLVFSPLHDDPYMEEISPPKDAETPVESSIPVSPSLSVGSSSPVRMPPKRTSTSKIPTMTQAAIRQLITDGIAVALENAYAQPIGIEQANKTTWTKLKRLLTNKYCPRTEVKKIEDEFYNLDVKGNDLKTYIRRFQELAVLCPNMVPNTEKLIEVFIRGLPRSIEGNVTASKPQTLEEAITITQRLIKPTDDELTEKELKQIEVDDQAIQTILLSLPKDIYAAVNSCETAQEICQNGVDMLPLFIRQRTCTQLITLNCMISKIQSEGVLNQDQPSFNQNYIQQPMPNPEDIINPTTAMNMALTLMAKAFKLNYSTPTNNNQRISSNTRNRQIAQPGNLNGYNAVQNNLNGNGNLVVARAEGNVVRHNGIQLQPEEFDLMAAAVNLDEIEEVNANCILMANLQQASTSGTQTDKAPVYDSDGSTEVHDYENCDDNEIFNMFTQEEQYTELLEPIPEPHQVPQNDNNVISEVTSVEQSKETVEQHSVNVEETRALYDSLYQNLAIKVEKVNSVNRKLKETNAELTTELVRFKNQEKCFEISQEKYDKLERCYQQSVYQEQCLSKKINALHLSFGKKIMTLNEEISYLNKQLSKEKSTVSFLLEEKKRLKS
nr:reverse transcriptase domain-containing protein [Tanacetum cinerariifolium]